MDDDVGRVDASFGTDDINECVFRHDNLGYLGFMALQESEMVDREAFGGRQADDFLLPRHSVGVGYQCVVLPFFRRGLRLGFFWRHGEQAGRNNGEERQICFMFRFHGQVFVELVDFGGVRFDKTPSAKEQSTKILGLSKTFLFLSTRLKPDESADDMNFFLDFSRIFCYLAN